MLQLHGICKSFHTGTANERQALRGVTLSLREGDFVTVVGGNGSGKSTLLGCIAGVHGSDRGHILLDGADVTELPEHLRARHLGRVFQDPMTGTAASMTIAENLALAARRGTRRSLAHGLSRPEREEYRGLLAELELGLEDRLSTPVGLLSGGQRQALTLLMATLRRPKLLLLDEHTAALDPKTAARVLDLSRQLVARHGLTALMVTHNMQDAIETGNRLVMMEEGCLVYEATGAEKRALTVPELVSRFGALPHPA